MHDISVAVLCSGSSGNSILAQSDGSAILVDAGISCRELGRRLSLFGVEPTQIEGVVLTHEHTDHTRGARRFCVEHGVPVYGTRGTLALTRLDDVRTTAITHGKSFQIGGFCIMPFAVPDRLLSRVDLRCHYSFRTVRDPRRLAIRLLRSEPS